MKHNFFNHLKTVHNHRMLVMKACFKVGLYKQGLLHDLSKYSISEFMVGVKYYQGYQSPNNAERDAIGYSTAWLHHKGRNKHHYEYWIDYSSELNDGSVISVEMPPKYFAEMVMDRIAASKTYKKENYTDSSPLEYFNLGKDRIPINKKNRENLEYVLTLLSKEGEAAMYQYIKEEVLKNEKINK